MPRPKVATARSILLVAGAVLICAASIPPASAQEAVDEDAAYALAKKGNCLKCHSVNKRKKAPAYAEIARKYKGRQDAQQVLYKHINGAPIVKLEDGDEPHAPPPSKDDKELYNLIRWILSRSFTSDQ